MIQTTIDNYFNNIHKRAETQLNIEAQFSQFAAGEEDTMNLAKHLGTVEYATLDKWAMECWMHLEQKPEILSFFDKQHEFQQILLHFDRVRDNYLQMPIEEFSEWISKFFPAIYHCEKVKVNLHLLQIQKLASDFEQISFILCMRLEAGSYFVVSSPNVPSSWRILRLFVFA